MFEKIEGNEKNKIQLSNIIEKNNISHSYMFVGISGIGKLLFAKEFSKAIFCESKGERPCNKCTECIKFENDNNPDFYLLDEGNDSIKNEQIRQINQKVLEKPTNSKKKIYIINNAENMTVSAQNSLLKTLEEPPEYAVIILIVNNENLILNTIKSRCTKIAFNNLSDDDIIRILKEKHEYDIESRFVKALNGSVEKALRLKGREEIYDKIEKTFTNLQNIDIIDLLKIKDEIFSDKEYIYDLLDYIINIFYLNKELTGIKLVEETKDRLRKNCNYDMTIDNFLFSIWEEING